MHRTPGAVMRPAVRTLSNGQTDSRGTKPVSGQPAPLGCGVGRGTTGLSKAQSQTVGFWPFHLPVPSGEGGRPPPRAHGQHTQLLGLEQELALPPCPSRGPGPPWCPAPFSLACRPQVPPFEAFHSPGARTGMRPARLRDRWAGADELSLRPLFPGPHPGAPAQGSPGRSQYTL